MSQDKRQHERITIVESHLQEYLFLHWNGRWYPLYSIHDLSISGVGVYFHELIEKDALVKMGFNSGDQEIVIRGRVIWSLRNPHISKSTFKLSSFHIGIEFDSHDHEEVMLLFQALINFLDGSTSTLAGFAQHR